MSEDAISASKNR